MSCSEVLCRAMSNDGALDQLNDWGAKGVEQLQCNHSRKWF